MQIYDTINKNYVEVEGIEGFIKLMESGRQVDLHFDKTKIDDDGYISWDVEHYSSVGVNKFIRTYTFKGKVLSEFTGYNLYDLKHNFDLENASKVELS